MTYGQRKEEEILFKSKQPSEDKAKHVFDALASHGANSDRLARLLIAWDFAMSALEWKTELANIVVHYQASVDAKYHDDFVKIATIEELDKRLSLRRIARQENQQSGS